MIFQTNFNKQIENIFLLLAQKYGDEVKSIEDNSSLKKFYNDFISHIQQRKVESDTTNIVIDNRKSREFLNIFNSGEETNLDDKNQKNLIKKSVSENIKSQYERVEASIKELEIYSKEHFFLLNTIITDIFLLPSSEARGGSSSTALGLIWANPKLDHSIKDLTEFLIHELTHNCMFIDELVYGHYEYASILDKTTWANSAILKMPRPLDKVVHSIAVSIEIVLYRDLVIGHPKQTKIHPPTEIMLNQLDSSIESLESILLKHSDKIILQDRPLEIIDNIKEIRKGL
ncbi:aKG-HExxH-type peptide beta-hydroxylase [Acinetobacter nosocomialis]|uniref:aKG-HExxH-type peptide beta-hydroxylase n=1 Tax=Acinetobacter nosocomialis TaxID=106654 RepID=UPI0034E2F428